MFFSVYFLCSQRNEIQFLWLTQSVGLTPKTSVYNHIYVKLREVSFYKASDTSQLEHKHNSGAPNENVFQNHLNIALLNVF